MARIRSLKIGFFRNEHLCALSFQHRLLFEGLWLIADKAGRLEDRPKRIHADLFPFDPALNVDVMLDELTEGEHPFIHRYVASGKRYIEVLNFGKHQRPHHTEPSSDIPGPETSDVLNPPEAHVDSPLDDGEPHEERGKGNGEGEEEGNGEGEGTAPRLVVARIAPNALMLAWNEGVTAPLPQCRELTEKRRTKSIARLAEATLDIWRSVIARIEASRFCRGENDRGWMASFDWLLQPDVRVKVLEGTYDNRPTKGHKGQPAPVPDMGWAEECRQLHGKKCNGRLAHANQMLIDADRALRHA